MILRQPVSGVSARDSTAATTKVSIQVATGTMVGPELAIAAQLVARLGRCTAQLMPRLATAALHLRRIEGWKRLGFRHANDFSCERLDRSGSWLRQLARLGRVVQELPALADAITGEDGGKPLGRAAAYEICRIARPDTVVDWIQRARGCTIRELKDTIRREQNTERAQNTGSSSVAATPSPRHWSSLEVRLPDFLSGALLEIERVFRATNPGSNRSDLLEALNAEFVSGSGMIDVGDACGDETQTAARGSRRLRVLPGATGNSFESGMQDNDTAVDLLDDNTSNRELQQARWTLHRVQLFIESLDEKASGAKGGGTSSPKHLEKSMRDILALEHEITLRIDWLLLWLDHRGAWSLLGYADAAEFGLKVLDESASTTRNRLRLARALERSAALRSGAESGQVSHQRLVRLAQLMHKHKVAVSNRLNTLNEPDERVMRQWVDHAAGIRIKRMDDEFDALERRRWCAAGVTVEAGQGDPAGLPVPLSDAEWQASLQLVPGEAHRRLLLGGLRALAADAPANVCQRFVAPEATIRDLRHSLNLARVRLAEQGRRLADQSLERERGTGSPADEARLFPSIRLAARHVERGRHIPDWICLLSLLEEFAEEWDNPRSMPRRPTDTIAARDGWRCAAPGCTSREIEVHHVVYRSHGGNNDPSNLTSVCPFHHRMGEHGGLLKVTGTAPLGLRWQIGDQLFMNERLVNERAMLRVSGTAS